MGAFSQSANTPFARSIAPPATGWADSRPDAATPFAAGVGAVATGDWQECGAPIVLAITALAPDTADRPEAGLAIEITGMNFTADAVPAISGTGIALSGVLVDSPTRITAVLDITSWAALGARSVTVSSIHGVSNAVSFTVTELTNGYTFPGNTAHKMPCGAITEFDNVTRLSLSVWFTVSRTGAFQSLASRWADLPGDASGNQLFFGLDTSNKLLVLVGRNGAGTGQALGSTVLVAGERYKATLVFDGTQVGNANRCKLYLSTRALDGSYPADVAEALAFSGTIGAQLSPGQGGLNLILGGTALAFNAFGGGINDVRVWLGTALALAAVQAEALEAQPTPASLWYPLNGGDPANYGGLAPAYPGVPTASVTPANV